MVRNLKYCQDPIKKHKKRITTNLRKVSEIMVERFSGKLKKGSLLCMNCCTMFMKNPSKLNIEACAEPINEEIELICESNNASPTKLCQLSSDDESGAAVQIATILPLLKQTPIKKRKLYIL